MLSSMLVRALVACRFGMRHCATSDYVIATQFLVAVQSDRDSGTIELAPCHDGFMQNGSQNWRGKGYHVAIFSSEAAAVQALKSMNMNSPVGDGPVVTSRLTWLKEQERLIGARLERLVPSHQHAA